MELAQVDGGVDGEGWHREGKEPHTRSAPSSPKRVRQEMEAIRAGVSSEEASKDDVDLYSGQNRRFAVVGSRWSVATSSPLTSIVADRRGELERAGIPFLCSPRPLLAAVSAKSGLVFNWRGVLFAKVIGEEENHREDECWVERGGGELVQGRVYLTNFRLIFIPNDPASNSDCVVELPVGAITKVEKSWTTPMSFSSDTRLMVLESKVDNSIRFRFKKHCGARRRLRKAILSLISGRDFTFAEVYARSFDIHRRKRESEVGGVVPPLIQPVAAGSVSARRSVMMRGTSALLEGYSNTIPDGSVTEKRTSSTTSTSPILSLTEVQAGASRGEMGRTESGGGSMSLDANTVGDTQFDFEMEAARMRISSKYRVSKVNSDYKMCASYPKCVIVPAHVSDESLKKVALFRRKGRIPAVVWTHPDEGNFSSLSRCSQPLVGLKRSRSAEDEGMLLSLLNVMKEGVREVERVEELTSATSPLSTTSASASSSSRKRGGGGGGGEKHDKDGPRLRVYDARPRVNAMANTMKGAGYEDVESNYPFCSLEFLGIDNIHVVRDSYNRVKALFDPTSTADDSKWLSNVEATGWLHHVRTIVKGAVKIAQCLEYEKWPALIHCSDGWDRTSQLTSLVQVMLDPYFRTFGGFRDMIEKEWIAFGHKFSDRLGQKEGGGNSDEFSPVFIQFLDCLHQIVHQFPSAFEYNENFVTAIAHEVFTCRHGTFLFNTVKEREMYSLARRGKQVHDRAPLVSMWYDVRMCEEEFRNPTFNERRYRQLFGRTIFPSTRMRHLKLWVEFFDEPVSEQQEGEEEEREEKGGGEGRGGPSSGDSSSGSRRGVRHVSSDRDSTED